MFNLVKTDIDNAYDAISVLASYGEQLDIDFILDFIVKHEDTRISFGEISPSKLAISALYDGIKDNDDKIIRAREVLLSNLGAGELKTYATEQLKPTGKTFIKLRETRCDDLFSDKK